MVDTVQSNNDWSYNESNGTVVNNLSAYAIHKVNYSKTGCYLLFHTLFKHSCFKALG